MRYSARSLVHSANFDRDCEQLFGSLAVADERLWQLLFDIAHDLACGITIGAQATVYANEDSTCLLVVEQVDDRLLLRACVAVGNDSRIAA